MNAGSRAGLGIAAAGLDEHFDLPRSVFFVAGIVGKDLQLRAVEFVALPETVFTVEEMIENPGGTTYRVTTAEYPYPAANGYYEDARSVRLEKIRPTERTMSLPVRAEILANLEANELDVTGRPKLARHLPSRKQAPQPTLFDAVNEMVIDELRNLDLTDLEAQQALEVLKKLKERVM